MIANRLDRYIARHVLSAIAVVLLIVVGLDLLSTLIDELDRLSERYGFGQLMQYLALTTPRRIYEMLPLSALVGCLVGLGTLASQSELTVMRAAGFSTARIVLAVFKPVFLLMVLELVLGQFIAPVTEQMADSGRGIAMARDGVLHTDEGAWHRDGNEFIHIAAVEPGGVIHGVTRYEFDEQRRLVRSSYAQIGEAVEDGWALQDVRETRFADGETQPATQSQELWQTALTPELLSVIIVEPADLSITGLSRYAAYLEAQGVNSDTYRLAFWGKLFQPLSIAALVLIGVSFIFGPLRNVTAGQRMVAGVIGGVGFKFAQDLLGPASSVFGFPPLLAILVPILICFLVGAWLLRRAG
ncbi:MAG: LPS export ABC transporter permease LptG [Oceanospirillaceae bacterium]|uniref:LPS export ABC transporter permease LptG n=1 Tax=Marinobacterium litorale TaxID=404770 RepID=UPI0003FD2F94|nr:LPS export ABC transporter permease LptG [Marinobacterium litorale]MBS98928.1 LPS export ABC transporter permease LptG [Oceanospirillaceae bacterium]